MLVNHLVKSIPIKVNTGLRLGYLWVLIISLIGLLIWQPRVYGAEQPVGLETADPATLNGKVEAVEAVEVVEIVEPDEPADPKTANSDQGADQAPDQAAPEDPAKPSSKKAKNDSRRFVPSESISEDLAVSFPVDI